MSARNLKSTIEKLKLDEDEAKLLPPADTLSEVFSEPLVQKQLHIVVRVPPQPDSPFEPEFDINCSVLNGDGRVFSVKIAQSASVDALKKAIKKAMEPEFDHVAAIRMDLWKVSFPDDQNLQKNIDNLDLDEKPLSSMAKLSRIFSDEPKDEHLHIVVRVPPTGGELGFSFCTSRANDIV